jgi:hypothetical protein
MRSAQNLMLSLGEGSRVRTIKRCWGEFDAIPAGSEGILLGLDIDPDCVNIAFEWGSDTINVNESGLEKAD